MTKIPTFQAISADAIETIELDSVIVRVRVLYNTRSGFYHLWLETEANRLTGVKIVPGYALLRYKKAALVDLPGDFVVFKTDESKGDEIEYGDLGAGWDLFYITASEYDTWEDARGLE
jgi:hypothetical protein